MVNNNKRYMKGIHTKCVETCITECTTTDTAFARWVVHDPDYLSTLIF
jgi:hypothetical protein